MEALTPARLSSTRRGIPDSRHLNVFCRSVSKHPVSSHVRFLFARCFSRSGVATVGPFPVCTHRFPRLRHSLAGSPRHKAESTFSRTDRQTRLPLLPTPPSGDAVTVGFQPVERLVESISTSSSDALSGARAGGVSPPRRTRVLGASAPREHRLSQERRRRDAACSCARERI